MLERRTSETDPTDGPAPWLVERLACPDCGGVVSREAADRMHCAGCGRTLAIAGRQVDARPATPRATTLEVPAHQVGIRRPAWSPPPDGRYRGPLLERTHARHLSVLAERAGRLDVLDWGCGTAQYRPLVAEVLGHRYAGLDVGGDAPDVLGDAHCLPFRAASFDHVITNAVLAHLTNPFLAMREVARVLRPGGVFSGSAAFLEPYCAMWPSHFHASPDGLVGLLTWAGLEVTALWAQERWTVLDALASIPGSLTPPTRWLLRRLGDFERMVGRWRLHPRHRASGGWLRERSAAERTDALLTIAGQVDFVARKPA